MSDQDKAALVQQAVPEGFALVPKKIEGEMREVLIDRFTKVGNGACLLYDDIWRDLLAAAPAASQAEQQAELSWLPSGNILARCPACVQFDNDATCRECRVFVPRSATAAQQEAPQAEQQTAISYEHGPWLPSRYDDNETYCKRCLTRSIFADKLKCDPHIVYTKASSCAALAAQQAEREPVLIGGEHAEAIRQKLRTLDTAMGGDGESALSEVIDAAIRYLSLNSKAQQAEREPLTAKQRTDGFGKSSLNDCSPQIDVWHAACAWTERAHGIGHHVPGQNKERS